MEDLNKNQIVLLTLLVSFVTSIATGIMTSTLLQEAPVEVTRNINRIVEKTIETVTPALPSSPSKEVTTVVVKEEDQVVDAINKNTKSVVRIKERNPFTDESSFYGLGVIITKEGNIITDRKPVTNTHIYTATLSDNAIITIIPQAIDKQTDFILFKVSDKDKSGNYPAATLSESDPKLGQTLISLGGDSSNAISVGRIISLDMKESGVGSSTTKYIGSINTDVASKDLLTGSPIFNLSGDIVGVKLGNDPLKTFTPISLLKKELPTLNEIPKEIPKESPKAPQN